MQRKITVFLFVAILMAFAFLQFGLWQTTSHAQLDPTAQMQTVNAVVNSRFTQTAQIEMNLTATAGFEATIQAQMNLLQSTNIAATIAAGGLIPAGSKNSLWTPQERDFDGVTMVLVPAGCFMMGTPDDVVANLIKQYNTDWFNNETPMHEVCITKPFWLDKYEVTQRQFRAKNGKAAYESYLKGDQRPVENISWYEALDYCKARGGDLPTEAQWEYAARGPESPEYPWGAWDPTKAVWRGNSNGQSANVGSIPEGASWVRAMDMSGNVWEWVKDWFVERYANAKELDPVGPSQGDYRVLRGGSWNFYELYARGATRVRFPDYHVYDGGFRCVRF